MPLHAATANGWQLFCGTLPLRAQRVLKGKGLIRKKGKTAGVPLLARSAAAEAAPLPARRGYSPRPVERIRKNGAPRSWPRPASLGPSAQFTFSRPTKSRRPRRPRSRPRCAGSSVTPCKAIPPPMAMGARRTPQVQSLTMTSPSRRWRGGPPPLKGEAGWVVQATYRAPMGWAVQIASVCHAHARDSSLRAVPSAQNDSGGRGRMGGADGLGDHAGARDPSLRSG